MKQTIQRFIATALSGVFLFASPVESAAALDDCLSPNRNGGLTAKERAIKILDVCSPLLNDGKRTTDEFSISLQVGWAQLTLGALTNDQQRIRFAIDYLSNSIEGFSDDGYRIARLMDAYFYRGFAYHMQSKRSEAISDYTKVVDYYKTNQARLHADHTKDGVVFGGVTVGHSILEEHAPNGHIISVLSFDPSYFSAIIQRGSAYQGMGLLEDALEDYDLLLKAPIRDAPRGRAHYEKANILANQKKLNQALDQAKAAVDNGGPMDAYILFAALLLGSSDENNIHQNLADAEYHLDVAVDKFTKFPDPWAHRARVRYYKKDCAGAIEDAEKALSLQPNNQSLLNFIKTVNETTDCR